MLVVPCDPEYDSPETRHRSSGWDIHMTPPNNSPIPYTARPTHSATTASLAHNAVGRGLLPRAVTTTVCTTTPAATRRNAGAASGRNRRETAKSSNMMAITLSAVMSH
jgi:hypothetical protein